MKISAFITLPIIAIAAGASAQDISAEPGFGTVDLEVGFMPDPTTVDLTAGGTIAATGELAAGCAGFIANAPDVDFNYVAGSMPLYLFATSDEDTTLVVNLPDGSWICNDDSDGFNPALAFAAPQSGLYNIWVGSYVAGEYPAAVLSITELTPDFMAAAGNITGQVAVAGPNIGLEPGFGTVTLETGFAGDPNQTEIVAGGQNEASELGDGCLGFIATAPDVDFYYTAGDTFPLNIYVTSEEDTTLAVNLPDGTWVCNDDSYGLNPLLNFESPASGLYNIYVGSYYQSELPAAVLNISEISPQW
ncbi:MAG: hypothetical protein ACJAYU_004389 [Bradymonadia bacterium]|jgi:hypothetical protein